MREDANVSAKPFPRNLAMAKSPEWHKLDEILSAHVPRLFLGNQRIGDTKDRLVGASLIVVVKIVSIDAHPF